MSEIITRTPDFIAQVSARLFESYFYQLSHLEFAKDARKAASLFAILTAIESKELQSSSNVEEYKQSEAFKLSCAAFEALIRKHPHQLKNQFERLRSMNFQLNPSGRK